MQTYIPPHIVWLVDTVSAERRSTRGVARRGAAVLLPLLRPRPRLLPRRGALRRLMAAPGGGDDQPSRSHDDAASGIVRVHFAAVSSTMDRARELSQHWGDSRDWIVVTTDQQRSGRGTGGRAWLSPPGNVYLSLGVSKARLGDALPMLPLNTGLATLHGALDCLPESVTTPSGAKGRGGEAGQGEGRLSVKWPNDVLLGDRKVSGMIIEDAGKHMIVGIGVNVHFAPEVGDGGRAAGRIADAGCTVDAAAVAERVVAQLMERVKNARDKADIVAEYTKEMDWDQTVYERAPGGGRGAALRPLRLTEHGHLVVRDDAGAEKTLMSEYLY
eukprot:TRINITY_DN24548_c0_g1_i2.p2 TRINITY_DN24548_c0_g1~~TRINITY_DN24548_c0_g1_i2.p2  ORF type:complete len:329 (+),score=98.56 TRINITY_DN24548_c0_g1_i2:65-1051(+)